MFKKITKFFSKSETKSTSTIPISTGSFLDFAIRGHNEVASHESIRFYKENSAISTAVDKIASAFEEMTPVLKDNDGNLINNSPVLDFLKKPNGFETWADFAGALSRHYLITGNAFITAFGNISTKPLEIFTVKPQNIIPIENTEDSYPGRYIANKGVGSGEYVRSNKRNSITRFYDGNLKEMFHIMKFSSKDNNILGDSPLSSIALEVKAQIQSRIHNLQLLNNGGNLSLIISFKDDGMLTQEEHEQRAIKINESFSGANNAGKIAVVSAPDMDIKTVGINNKDMDYAKLDQIASQTIYLKYGIPLSLVTVTASTFNNVQTGVLSFYDNTAIPHFNILLSGLSLLLLPRFGIDINKFKLSFDPYQISALKTRMLNELKLKSEMNIETKNELREGIPNRQNIEGGDVLYQNAGDVPLGTDLISTDNML